MHYRLATPEDLNAVADLRWNFIKEDGGDIAITQIKFQDFFRNWSKQHPHCFHFVAEEDDKIVSMMSLFVIDPLPRPIQNNSAWGYLTNSYTIPTERNKGIASGLLQFVKDWIQQKGLETTIVWPSEQSIQFYKHGGFDAYNRILELRTTILSD